MPQLKCLLRALLSGALAFCVLTGFACFYDNTPVHYTCEDGATDDRWEGHSFFSKFTEGFAWGGFNNEGYRNPFDYNPGMNVDVLIVGSSYMEALQVTDENTMSYRLGALLPNMCVYNIGMDGHNFIRCASNLNAAVQKYRPKYVVLETHSIQFSDEELQSVLNRMVPERESFSEGIFGHLQKNQFLRLLYHQMMFYISQIRDDGSTYVKEDYSDLTLMKSVLSIMFKDVSDSGAELVVVYHPAMMLNADGSLSFSTTQEQEDVFAGICEENGIHFLSMRERFIKEYEGDHVLPYGFINSSVGSGHLNRCGHEMMAEELYAWIQEVGA